MTEGETSHMASGWERGWEKGQDGLPQETALKLGHLSMDDAPPLAEKEAPEGDALTAPPTDVDVKTRILHTVSAAAASAFTEAGYAPFAGMKLHMRTHLGARVDRLVFAEDIQAFGETCAKRSTVGIAVVSTVDGVAEAWLFEVEGGSDEETGLRPPVTDDGDTSTSPPSLLLRHVDLQEDYLANYKHGSAIGIDPTEGVTGVRLPEGEDVPRHPLAATEEE